MLRPEAETLRAEALEAIGAASDADELLALERRYLGKGGVVGAMLGAIKDAPAEERRTSGNWWAVEPLGIYLPPAALQPARP